jgi:hypothetical protein
MLEGAHIQEQPLLSPIEFDVHMAATGFDVAAHGAHVYPFVSLLHPLG